MLRRYVDLTLTVYPDRPGHYHIPPHFVDVEPMGPERDRVDIFGFSQIKPFYINGSRENIYMDVVLTHSIPHTHVETLLNTPDAYFRLLPREQEWVIRDVSKIPVTEQIGEAVILDFTDVGRRDTISLSDIQSAGKSIRRGDMAIVRTDFIERFQDLVDKEEFLIDAPGISPEAARWLCEEKEISVFATDASADSLEVIRKTGTLASHRVFYNHGVLMVDYITNLSQIKKERVLLSLGISLKTAESDASPARIIAFDNLDDLPEGNVIDLFLPMKSNKPVGKPPYKRSDPAELEALISRRYGLYGFQMSLYNWGLDKWTVYKRQVKDAHPLKMMDWPHYISFSNKLGTYIEVPFCDLEGHGVPDDKLTDVSALKTSELCGEAVVLDLTDVGPRQNIDLKDLQEKAKGLKKNDIVILKTGYTDSYYHYPERYLEYSPGLSIQAAEWLAEQGIKMLVVDFPRLEIEQSERTQRVCHYKLFKQGIPIVKCATDVWKVRKERVYLIVSPIPLARLNASPVRLMAIEEYR